MKPSRLEEFANRHFWSLIVGIFIVFCFFSYGIGHASAAKGQVYTIDVGHYDPVEMQQPVPMQESVWANGTYSNSRVSRNLVVFDIQDKLTVDSTLTITPTSGTWMWYPENHTGNRLTYTNTRGIVSYTNNDSILKETITLYAPVSSIQWVLNLSMKPQALGFQVDPDGYSIRDPTNADQRIKIPFPFVTDANGVKRILSFSWNNGQRRLSLVQDFAGLQYPLIIDPTWEVDTSGDVGLYPVVFSNQSATMVIYGDNTNNLLKMFVNKSGEFSLITLGEITVTASRPSYGATIIPATDLPLITSAGIGSYTKNLTWFAVGKWRYAEIGGLNLGGNVYGNIPIGVTSSGRVLGLNTNGTYGPLNLTRVEDITGISLTSYEERAVTGGDINSFYLSGGLNATDILNVIWASAGNINLTTATNSATPSLNTIVALPSRLNLTSFSLGSDINPATDFPGVGYVPLTAASTANNGRAVNYSYYQNGKWYEETAYENTTVGGMSRIEIRGVTLKYNTTTPYIVFIEEANGAGSSDSNRFINYVKRIGTNSWSSPITLGTNVEAGMYSSFEFDNADGLHVSWYNTSGDDLEYYYEALPVSAAGAPPVASFTKNDTVLHLNEAINLSDTSSCTGCTNRQWNLTLETPADSYHKNESSLDWTISAWPRWGYYSIVKYLQNASGSDDATDHFTVINITPAAVFTCAPLSGTRPLTTTCTHANTGNWTKYNWTAGDGTNISALANPSFTYTVAGSYSVNETIWGDDLEYSIELKTNYITVTDPAPPTTPVPGAGNCTGSIDTNVSEGYPPLWVNLSYIGNNTVIDNITWMFGEGNTSTDWSPTAVYNWSATFEASAYACNTTFNECCTATAKIWAWFFTCLQTGEDGNIPVALMYLLIPLTMGLSLFAVGSYDNRVYANIILGGFGSSIMWFYLAANVITANVFYLASDPGCVMMDTPLFWLFILFGIIMTVYSVALVMEAVMERNVQDLGGEEE